MIAAIKIESPYTVQYSMYCMYIVHSSVCWQWRSYLLHTLYKTVIRKGVLHEIPASVYFLSPCTYPMCGVGNFLTSLSNVIANLEVSAKHFHFWFKGPRHAKCMMEREKKQLLLLLLFFDDSKKTIQLHTQVKERSPYCLTIYTEQCTHSKYRTRTSFVSHLPLFKR